MLTDCEKIDARRYMGYPVFGTNPSGNMGWQFYQAAGLLEFRLNNLAPGEEVVLRQYLTTISCLEQAVPDASASLDTSSAGEWVRNPIELAERRRLLEDWSRRLCGFLGLPPGPYLSGGGNTVNLVV
jgi:hypothetical protein